MRPKASICGESTGERTRKMHNLPKYERCKSWHQSRPKSHGFTTLPDNRSCPQKGRSPYNISAQLSMTRSGFFLSSPTIRRHLHPIADQQLRITTPTATGLKPRHHIQDSRGHRITPLQSMPLTDLSLLPISTHHPTFRVTLNQSGTTMDHPAPAHCALSITSITSPILLPTASNQLQVSVSSVAVLTVFFEVCRSRYSIVLTFNSNCLFYQRRRYGLSKVPSQPCKSLQDT